MIMPWIWNDECCMRDEQAQLGMEGEQEKPSFVIANAVCVCSTYGFPRCERC